MGITASINVLSLGRPEVLRSLRHYQWGQSQGHHTIDHLERGTERGSVWEPSLKGWDRAIDNQVNIVSWKMWSIEELETLPVGQSQGHHTIDHLDRWAERGSVWWPSLKGWERAIVNQVNTGTISKQQRQCGWNFWKVGQSASERREYHLGLNGTEDEGSNPGLCSNPLLPLLTSGVVNRCLVLQTRGRLFFFQSTRGIYIYWRSYSNRKMPWQNSAEIPPLIDTD